MKKTKKRELKESVKNIINILLILLNYQVININLKAVKMHGAGDGIYSMRYIILIFIMLMSSNYIIKKINNRI